MRTKIVTTIFWCEDVPASTAHEMEEVIEDEIHSLLYDIIEENCSITTESTTYNTPTNLIPDKPTQKITSR